MSRPRWKRIDFHDGLFEKVNLLYIMLGHFSKNIDLATTIENISHDIRGANHLCTNYHFL